MAVQIGLNSLHYALLNTDAVGSISYQAPIAVPGAITANINSNSSNETLFADDGPAETASTIGKIDLELNVADIPLDLQAIWLGHTRVGGILKRSSSDVPPWLAIGFKSLKSNGKYRFAWLLKGKFQIPELNHETKGDAIAFQTPTITGSFVKREYDSLWLKESDEDDPDYVPSIGTNWFLGVETVDTTPPTVSTNIADGASGVSVATSFIWTFDEAVMASTVVGSNMFLMKADGTPVVGTLSINSLHTIVTFTPSVALSASTDYIAICTTNIKDLSGNALAANSVVNFQTA